MARLGVVRSARKDAYAMAAEAISAADERVRGRERKTQSPSS